MEAMCPHIGRNHSTKIELTIKLSLSYLFKKPSKLCDDVESIFEILLTAAAAETTANAATAGGAADTRVKHKNDINLNTTTFSEDLTPDSGI